MKRNIPFIFDQVLHNSHEATACTMRLQLQSGFDDIQRIHDQNLNQA